MSAGYEIRIKGRISQRMASSFEGFDVSTETVLRADMRDPSVLQRALQTIRDLGLELVDVHSTDGRSRP